MASEKIITVMALCAALCGAPAVGQAQATAHSDIRGFFRFERVAPEFLLGINVVKPFDNVLLLGSSVGLVRSMDEGRTWEGVLSPLHRKDITTIVANDGEIVAGTAGGGIYRSTDLGLYWERFGSDPRLLRIKTLLKTGDGYVASTDSGACFTRRTTDTEWQAMVLPARCLDLVRFRDETWIVCINGDVLADNGRGPKLRGKLQVTGRTTLVAVDNLLAVVLDSVVVVLDGNADSLARWRLPITDWTACAALDGQLLLGGRATGLKKLNLETGVVTFAFAGPAEIETISALAVSGDTVIVGTNRGSGRCYVVSQSTYRWHVLNPSGMLNTFDVSDLDLQNGFVYVATRGEGIHAGHIQGTVLAPIHEGYEHSMVIQLQPWRDEILVVGRRAGLWRMKDGKGRLEWFTRSLPISSDYFATVIGTRVVVGLSNGRIVWSDDGRTWLQSNDTVPRINDMSTVGESIYASTSEGLYRSDDNGQTWQVVPGPWHLKMVLWATGAPDTLLITTEHATYRHLKGSQTRVIQAESTEGVSFFITALLYKGLLFTTGMPGVYVSTDVGETWEKTTIDKARSVISQFFYNGYYYVFTDTGGLWRSPIP